MKPIFYIILLTLLPTFAKSANIWIEAESFKEKGGWVLDQQFIDQMGSSYLMAHGLGNPVKDATTNFTIKEKGIYYVYVRTYNWTSPWYKGCGAGKFQLKINDKTLPTTLGCTGNEWGWEEAGVIQIKNKNNKIVLHDLTGFNGRCDAIYLTTNKNDIPPKNVNELYSFRKEKMNLKINTKDTKHYDFIVVGGGIAGMSAAITASRLGCKVALVHDRPVLGGNNSSEVRVHLGGRIDVGLYPKLGSLQKEFGPSKGGNAQPKEFYEDKKKLNIIKNEKNITLYSSYRAFAAEKKDSKITKVFIRNIETNQEIALTAPIFADCTGDANLGYMVGAEYKTGREARSEYNEQTAPLVADSLTMGASVQWYSEQDKDTSTFPIFNYGINFNEKKSEKVFMGEWTWETGMNRDQINEAEYIRDYGLLVVFSNWSFLKNQYSLKEKYAKYSLKWVAFIAGKRESRRLIGDHILTENDLINYVEYPDATGSTTWTIDLHYPDPINSTHFHNNEFKSICKMIKIHPYPVPYRCLYSRNIDNLFMAGRDISATHIALGTVRVMRTTGILGEVVGMAASLCKKNNVVPRTIYTTYLNDLKDLMKKGVSPYELPNNQTYNLGETLGPKNN